MSDFARQLEQMLEERFTEKPLPPVPLIPRPVALEVLLWGVAGVLLVLGLHLFLT